MPQVAILTDSTASIPEDMLGELNIRTVAYYIHRGKEVLRDLVTIQRDTFYKGEQYEVPLIRIGFPIFDRHHLHRMTTLGYEGAMYMLTTLVNSVLEQLDKETKGMGTTDYQDDHGHLA